MKRVIYFILGLCLFVLGPSGLYADGAATSENLGGSYLIGTGIYDITGPIAEIGMMGYSAPEQVAEGLHTRLWARSFIVAERDGKRVAVVVCDLGQLFQAVKQQVVNKIKESAELSPYYNEENVMLSATHTHSGPGGYSHYFLYNLSILEFNKQNFDAIVDGIYHSLLIAHRRLAPGNVLFNQGTLYNASSNRSPIAYMQNPAEERAKYADDIDHTMTVLKFVRGDGKEIGALTWFANHATSISNQNRLISSDNRGFASYLFEKKMGTNYLDHTDFVAGFAQAAEGDVSPNVIFGSPPDGIHDFERMDIIGRRQFNKAFEIYSSATQELAGPVDFRHSYINFADHPIAPEWLPAGTPALSTCYGAVGLSKLAGAHADGPAIKIIKEGTVWGKNWPEITVLPEDQQCQAEKVIVLPITRTRPYPLSPEVLPLTILRLGPLAIAALPFEPTTMVGRRIQHTVGEILAPAGVTHVQITGLANAYGDYLTTREEFASQQYEGGSNNYGPYTLNLCQQEFARLAVAMDQGVTVERGPEPRDLSHSQILGVHHEVVLDSPPSGKHFGDVSQPPQASYQRGTVASASFWGGHPKNNLMTGSSYLIIEKQTATGWAAVAHDWDPETKLHWKRVGVAASEIAIYWQIPLDAEPGTYRIVHVGYAKPLTKPPFAYQGVSPAFVVN